jgi:hypothetical protein
MPKTSILLSDRIEVNTLSLVGSWDRYRTPYPLHKKDGVWAVDFCLGDQLLQPKKKYYYYVCLNLAS